MASAEPEKVGIFGAQKRAEALLAENLGLAEENQRLRQQVSALLGMNEYQLAAESGRLRTQIEADAERDRAGARGQHSHRLSSLRSRKHSNGGPANPR